MGFILADTRALKTAFGFDLFVYWLDMGWYGGQAENFRLNFDELARKIEPHGVALVRCLFEAPLAEICKTYLNKDIDSLSNILPAILITDCLPDEVDDATMRLLIPINKVIKMYGNLDEFLALLVLFAKNKDTELLKRFEDKKSKFWKSLEVFELKPNFFGIGINFNNIISMMANQDEG